MNPLSQIMTIIVKEPGKHQVLLGSTKKLAEKPALVPGFQY